MRISTFGVILTIVVLAPSGLRGQPIGAPAPAPAAPSKQAVEVTEEKKVVLNAEMAEFEAVNSLLDELGKATVKRKGESSRDYVVRANKIFKAQAYLVGLAAHRVESALDAKYQLESEVRDYARWVEHLSGRLRGRMKLYQADVESLAKEVQETRYDGQVLAYLISTQGGFEKAIQDRYAKEYPAAGIQGVPDYQARQEKYQKIPKEKWQEEFQKLVRQVEIKAMKRQFLIVKAIPESQELDDVLPAEHRRVLQEATEVLQKYSDLERTADQIAVYAKYVDGNLDLVSSINLDAFSPDVVEKAEAAARQVEGGLKKIVPTGVSLPPRVGIMMGELSPSTAKPASPRP